MRNIICKKINISILSDFVLNLIATIVVTCVTQLILYPLLAKMYSEVEYGIILTVMGVGNTIVSSFGNSVNNVRLMVNTDYVDQGQEGDFLPLISILSIIGTVVFAFYLSGTTQLLRVTGMLVLFFALVGSFRIYGSVAFRLSLNYKNILLCNILMSIGNLLGITCIYVTKQYSLWPVSFLFSELFGFVFIFLKTGIYRERFALTPLFRSTVGKECILLITTLSANILTYLDRILLLPVLGGASVATYTTASFFGKSLAILMTPMSSVLLSYYSQKGYEMSRKRFWNTNGWMALLSFLYFFVSLFISPFITGLLYPKLIENARPFLVIANLTAILGVCASMTQPAVLKFAPTFWQFIIQVVYCVVYLAGGIVGANMRGIQGFAYAALAATMIKLIMLYFIGDFTLKKHDKQYGS